MHRYHLTLQRATALNVAVYGAFGGGRHDARASALPAHAGAHTRPAARRRLPLPRRPAAGNFSAPKAHEVVVARGTSLELLRPDDAGRLHTVASSDAFGLVRALAPLRLTGQTTDHLVVSSDSGRVAVLQFKRESGGWAVVHLETYGKTGVRRVTPGQVIAREPHGRAFMVAAVEKQKLVYVMNRDAANNQTIS